jgi:hypothetical protein
MTKWGAVAGQILHALETVGPMTRVELCAHLGIDRGIGAAIANRMARPSATMPKRVHIAAYVYDQEGQRRYPRAVYAIGDMPDAKRPKSDVKANKRRYIQAKVARFKMNSVFNMGLTRRQVEERIGARV